MSIFKRISHLFAVKKPENELHNLNISCNKKFETVFKTCRLQFGRELVMLMDMKRHLFEITDSDFTPVQDMLAKKVLELMNIYFDLAHSFVSVKANKSSDEMTLGYMESTKEKMDKVYSLMTSLNSQFYMKAEALDPASKTQDLINEAEALSNVLKNNNLKKMV